MASGGCVTGVSDMESDSSGEILEDFVDECAVSTQNRFEQRKNGAYHNEFKTVSRKRKKGSSGSIDGFAGMQTNDKLICIFEQLNRNYDKIKDLELKQTSYRDEVRMVNECVSSLNDRLTKMEELCESQRWNAKILSYKSIDSEARSMRNNVVIYGLTEKCRYNSKSLVFNFLEDELDIDTSEMQIDRAHRLGQVPDEVHRKRQDPKRPMVVRFRDYVDTEIILSKSYKLKGTNFGVDRQYPKEISVARANLYKSKEAREARSRHQKVQLRYPARLFIDGKCVHDALPDWFKVLGSDRLKETKWHDLDKNKNERVYSESTVVDNDRESDENSGDSSEVFEERFQDEISTESGNTRSDVNKRESRDQCVNMNCVENKCENSKTKGDENLLPVRLIDSISLSSEMKTSSVPIKTSPRKNKTKRVQSNTRVHIHVNEKTDGKPKSKNSPTYSKNKLTNTKGREPATTNTTEQRSRYKNNNNDVKSRSNVERVKSK